MQIAILWLACATSWLPAALCRQRAAATIPKAGLPSALQLDPALLHSTGERHGSHEGLLQVGGCRSCVCLAASGPPPRAIEVACCSKRVLPTCSRRAGTDIIRPSPPPAGTVGGSSLWHAQAFLLCPACPGPPSSAWPEQMLRHSFLLPRMPWPLSSARPEQMLVLPALQCRRRTGAAGRQGRRPAVPAAQAAGRAGAAAPRGDGAADPLPRPRRRAHRKSLPGCCIAHAEAQCPSLQLCLMAGALL